MLPTFFIALLTITNTADKLNNVKLNFPIPLLFNPLKLILDKAKVKAVKPRANAPNVTSALPISSHDNLDKAINDTAKIPIAIAIDLIPSAIILNLTPLAKLPAAFPKSSNKFCKPTNGATTPLAKFNIELDSFIAAAINPAPITNATTLPMFIDFINSIIPFPKELIAFHTQLNPF